MNVSEPCDGLKMQLGGDEEVEWVVEKDVRTEILGALAQLPGILIAAATFGVFGGVFLGGALAPLVGDYGFVAGFLVPFLGFPFLVIGGAVVRAKLATVQYASTTDRFIKHDESFTGSDGETVPKANVRDVEVSRDAVDKLLGNADIKIEGEKGYDTVEFDNVDQASELVDKIRADI